MNQTPRVRASRLRFGVLRFGIIVFAFSWLLSGCTSLIYKTTGDVLIKYGEDVAVPYLMTTDDPYMGCAMSESLGPLFFSFGEVTTPPDQLGVLLYMMAGMCAEQEAWEHELRYLRAIYHRNVQEAQDARIAQKRAMTLAAQRQLKGYESVIRAFGEPGGECPRLSTDNEELFWMVGLLDGVQGLFSDIAAEGAAGVPMDVAAKAARGAQCLENEKWWGVPMAIQAAVWTAIPSTKPKGEDPYTRLEESVEIGKRVGVRITQVLQAQIFMGKGDTKKVKQIIRDHVQAKERVPSNPMLRILDEVATMQLQAISDRLWTEATGKRTPIGQLGSFWDDPKEEVESLDLDSIL